MSGVMRRRGIRPLGVEVCWMEKSFRAAPPGLGLEKTNWVWGSRVCSSKLSSLWGAPEGRKPCFQREPVGISHPQIAAFYTTSSPAHRNAGPTIDPFVPEGWCWWSSGGLSVAPDGILSRRCPLETRWSHRFGPSLAELQIVLSIAHVVGVPGDVQHAIRDPIHVVGQRAEDHKRARTEDGFFRVELHVWQFKRRDRSFGCGSREQSQVKRKPCRCRCRLRGPRGFGSRLRHLQGS